MTEKSILNVFCLDEEEAEVIAAEKEEEDVREGSDEEELFKAGFRD